MSELRIVDPSDGKALPRGSEFDVVHRQQVQGGPVQGDATLQFASSLDGPWMTCRPIGTQGAIQCDAVPWVSGASGYTLAAVITRTAYIRAAVFGSVDAQIPFLTSENAVRLVAGPKKSAQAE